MKGSEGPVSEGSSTSPSCTVISVKDSPIGVIVKVDPLWEQDPVEGVQVALVTPKSEGRVTVRLVKEGSNVAPMVKGDVRVRVRLEG